MGASRYMAVAAHKDDQTGRRFVPGEFVSGNEYARMGDPDAFAPADFPEDVERLRVEHGIDQKPQETQPTPTVQGDVALDGLSVDELRQLAAEHEIDGRSQMNKGQLLEALRAQ